MTYSVEKKHFFFFYWRAFCSERPYANRTLFLLIQCLDGNFMEQMTWYRLIWRFALIFSICSIYVCSFPAKSPSSTWYSISVEMNSTLLTCTNITAKLRTKDCLQHIHNLTPESTFTLDQESARDICHFPLTAPEKKLPLQHGRAALFVHAENTSKNHFVPTKWLKNIFFPTVTAATMNKLRG